MPQHTFPPRVYLLAIAISVMTAGYAISRLAGAVEYQDPYPFRIQQQRLAAVRTMIAKEAKIGYLSNLKPSDEAFARLYFPTQFVLAPTLLIPLEFAPNTEFVLGNYTRPEDYQAVAQTHGLVVEREFPMGVVLFRRAVAGEAQ